MRSILVGLCLCLAVSTAHALTEKEHGEVTMAACTAAGLPQAFCDRAAAEAFNVDRQEFDDLVTHAQLAVAQTPCDGANAVVAREHGLGSEAAAALTSGSVDEVARALGRGLHTLHDNCAHHGVSNPEHAWFSLSDECQGTALSPDKAPGAMSCAREETDQALAGFVGEVEAAGLTIADLASATAIRRREAKWWDKCTFLSEADDWDGRDVGWDRDRMRAPLRAGFLGGLRGEESPGDVCGGDPAAIAASNLQPDVDVSNGTPSCWKIHLYCLGRADAIEAASDAEPAPSAGCAVARAATGGLWLAALALGLLVWRRRR